VKNSGSQTKKFFHVITSILNS